MGIKKGTILISLGVLMLLAALGLTGYNVYEGHRAEEQSRATVTFLDETIPQVVPEESVTAEELSADEADIPDYVLNPDMEMPVLQHEGRDYIGKLSIPALGLELPVISQWSYPALKIAPCRYAGTAYTDGFVIAAHNYRAHFASLSSLNTGDLVTFTDVDGNLFQYEVAAKETLAPTAIEEMTADAWPLTLFTCTVGGASRVTVRCDRAPEL